MTNDQCQMPKEIPSANIQSGTLLELRLGERSLPRNMRNTRKGDGVDDVDD
jgi:hypothetical protein